MDRYTPTVLPLSTMKACLYGEESGDGRSAPSISADRISGALELRHKPVSRVRFRSSVLTAGSFDLDPSHPEFESAGQISAPTVVFPKTSVWIQHEHEPAFATDFNIVTYYNTGQPYVRQVLAPEGDHCHWFEFSEAVARDVVSLFQPASRCGALAPFDYVYGPSDRSSYFTQQQVMQYLRRAEAPDVLYVEETMLRVFCRLVAASYERKAVHLKVPLMCSSKRRELAEDVRFLLATRFAEQLSLREIGEAVGGSVFHICRVFKTHTGKTIYDYRNELRLRRAVNLLAEANDLTELALDIGYYSHSHFTRSFRRAFGATPSEIRRVLRCCSREIR